MDTLTIIGQGYMFGETGYALVNTAGQRANMSKSELIMKAKQGRIAIENARISFTGNVEVIGTGDSRQIRLYEMTVRLVNDECKKRELRIDYVRQAIDKNRVDIKINGVASLITIDKPSKRVYFAGWVPHNEDIAYDILEADNTEGLLNIRKFMAQYIKTLKQLT